MKSLNTCGFGLVSVSLLALVKPGFKFKCIFASQLSWVVWFISKKKKKELHDFFSFPVVSEKWQKSVKLGGKKEANIKSIC